MIKRLFIAIALIMVGAGQAFAQACRPCWDAPQFFSPRPMDDIGLYAFKSDLRVADDPTGLKLIWRQSGNLNLGVHAGTADLENFTDAILLGAELYGPLTGATASTGLMMSWSLGGGAVFGEIGGVDYLDLSVPLGVSVGLNLGAGSSVSLLPYVHPRVSLDVSAADTGPGGEEETETGVGFVVDLGADVNLGRSLILRVGGTLGDREAFGAGLALRMPRKVVVR